MKKGKDGAHTSIILIIISVIDIHVICIICYCMVRYQILCNNRKHNIKVIGELEIFRIEFLFSSVVYLKLESMKYRVVPNSISLNFCENWLAILRALDKKAILVLP